MMVSYSLRQARHLLKHVYGWYRKNQETIDKETEQRLKNDLHALDQAIVEKNRNQIDLIASRLDIFSKAHCKKTAFTYIKELAVALVFALVIATLIRQMWFELYEIPSGSMRPTFREQDHVTVSKTQFGINIPLETHHFYFDPALVQRGSIVIFSGANIPTLDQTTTYFGLFPYTKRYVKRMIGKPGDSLYFYGGKLYGIDKDGKALTDLLNTPWMDKLDYVPMLSFDQNIRSTGPMQFDLSLMNQALGRLQLISQNNWQGQVYNGQEWVKDNPLAQTRPHNKIETYSDFYGMRNYAQVRLLTPEELAAHQEIDSKGVPEGILYLELRHTPSISYPKPFMLSNGFYRTIAFNPFITVIPLQQEHLERLMAAMYTARFAVTKQKGSRYSADDTGQMNTHILPSFVEVDDGMYEFYHGQAYSVNRLGILSDVPRSSPLYTVSAQNVQKLFNLGIDFNNVLEPTVQNVYLFPHRYAYFRDGDLYVLGAPLMKKDEPALIAFQEREFQKQRNSSPDRPYVPFRDYGAPLKEDGSYAVDFIRTFGVTVPQDQYLVLGDNHAMSSDSRIFGFVPQNNLQGVPSLIIWPPGERWGFPMEKSYPLFVTPRLIVWSIVAIILAVWYWMHRRSMSRFYIKKPHLTNEYPTIKN